jgi:putative SOS response-associated peptidase YedK
MSPRSTARPFPAVTVITTDAAGESARVSYRMLGVLACPEERAAWLSPGLSPADVTSASRSRPGVTIQPVTF